MKQGGRFRVKSPSSNNACRTSDSISSASAGQASDCYAICACSRHSSEFLARAVLAQIRQTLIGQQFAGLKKLCTDLLETLKLIEPRLDGVHFVIAQAHRQFCFPAAYQAACCQSRQAYCVRGRSDGRVLRFC